MIKTRLIDLVPESKKYIVLNVFAQWIGMCANVIMIMTIAMLLNDLASGHQVLFPGIGMIIMISVMVRILCVKLAASASYHASRSVKRTLRGMIYKKILRLGTSYTENVSTGEIIQLAGEGVEQLETYFGAYLPQFFYAMLAPITLFIIVSRISMKVAVVILVCVPLIPVSIVIVQKIAKRFLNKYWSQYSALGDHFLENLQGLTTLKIYQADELRHQEMNQDAEQFRVITMKVLSMQLNSIIVMDIIAYGGAALGIALALMARVSGQIDFVGCFTIILLSADFFLPMRQLGSFFHIAMNGMAASDKIFRLLDLPEEAEKNEVPNSNEIIVSNLRFAYTQEKEVLHGVDLAFEEGSFTALVGKSGCGKSTVASILLGRNKGYSGRVSFDGTELSHISENELMKRITYISHDSYLFKGSIRDNLLMGKPNAVDEELWTVLDKVKLAEFIHGEGGLDFSITEGASNLSGGQRQRLALARALLHDSPIYIFDEATSNIDVESENDIMSLVRKMAHHKTVILISHRLANTMNADNIYVMERGNIVQSGMHKDLLAGEGVYKTLWEGQQVLESITKEAAV